MIVIYSVFLTTLQNREKAKKCGLQKENGFLIVYPKRKLLPICITI